jgi:hypothetical protein
MVQMTQSANAEKKAKVERQLQSLDRLAWLLDSSIRIPGTNRTIGLDGIIGLLPGIGDVVSGVISGYIVVKALLMGLPIFVIARMVVNLMIEGIIGVIPVVGDLFDFIFKSNKRNVRLMQTYLQNPEDTAERSFMSVIVFLMVLFFVFLLSVWMIFKVLGFVFSLI